MVHIVYIVYVAKIGCTVYSVRVLYDVCFVCDGYDDCVVYGVRVVHVVHIVCNV